MNAILRTPPAPTETLDANLDEIEAADVAKLTTVEGMERRCGVSLRIHDISQKPSQGDVARSFVALFETELRFMSPGSQWHYWNGQRWQRDTSGTIATLMQRHVKRIAERLLTAGMRAGIDNNGFIAGALAMASRHDPIKVDAAQLDADKLALGTPSGIVDLKTGAFRKADKDALVTMATSCDPADAEDCPRWHQFLREITNGDDAMVEYIRLWLGYCATGSIKEEQFLFVHADGGTGKGTLLQTVERILGDYARSISMDVLLAKEGKGGHASPIASLRGRRLVIASETEKDSYWNASRLKEMTGGDTISANFMHQDTFTFRPVLKLIGQGEHLPKLKHVGKGETRRIRVLPLQRASRAADKSLKNTLAAEAPGILRWLINAAVAWNKLSFHDGGGLQTPEPVRNATARYFAGQGIVRQFLHACCDIGEGFEASGNDLNMAWRIWSKAHGAKGNLPADDIVMVEGVSRVTRTGSKAFYTGIKLKR